MGEGKMNGEGEGWNGRGEEGWRRGRSLNVNGEKDEGERVRIGRGKKDGGEGVRIGRGKKDEEEGGGEGIGRGKKDEEEGRDSIEIKHSWIRL